MQWPIKTEIFFRSINRRKYFLYSKRTRLLKSNQDEEQGFRECICMSYTLYHMRLRVKLACSTKFSFAFQSNCSSFRHRWFNILDWNMIEIMREIKRDRSVTDYIVDCFGLGYLWCGQMPFIFNMFVFLIVSLTVFVLFSGIGIHVHLFSCVFSAVWCEILIAQF